MGSSKSQKCKTSPLHFILQVICIAHHPQYIHSYIHTLYIIHIPYIYTDTHVHIHTSYIHTYTCIPNVFYLQLISFFLCFYSLGCFYFPVLPQPQSWPSSAFVSCPPLLIRLTLTYLETLAFLGSCAVSLTDLQTGTCGEGEGEAYKTCGLKTVTTHGSSTR